MPTPTSQLLSRTSYAGDGVTTSWNFSFSGGYISRNHVKAYKQTAAGLRTELVVAPGDFIGEFQLSVIPAIPIGYTLTIYRDTPKDLPLVDFVDGSNFNEASLDTMAKQAVFIAAETKDSLDIVAGPGVAAAAEAAANSANIAQAAATAAQAAAAEAADDVLPAVLAAIAPDITTATNAAISASASAASASNSQVQAALSAADCVVIAGSVQNGFGFNPNGAYDFGSILDPNTYLNIDCGTVP